MRKIIPASRVKNIRYAIREVVGLANEVKASGKKMCFLNIGDPNIFDFKPPQHMIDAVYQAMMANKNGYSPSSGIEEARDSIRSQAKRNGIQDIRDIIITHGASEGIELCLTGLLEAGENVLLPQPGYPLYSSIMAKLNAEVNPYYLNEENGWNLDISDIESRINKKTRAIVVINPNNPTGAVYPKETLLEIIELARKYNLLLFSDEIYDKLLFDNGTYTSMGSLCNDVPIVTFNGLSKSYVVPGFRIGWAIFSGPIEIMSDYIDGVNKMARARLSANHPVQFAIKTALDGPQDHIKTMLETLTIRRDLTVNMLNEIEEFDCKVPKGAFYAFPTLRIPDKDEDFVKDLIRETGVVTVHGSGFGQKPGTKHLRIVFLPNETVLEQAYDNIRAFVKKRYH
ncbi:MAG: aminotransferase class I/II-fold pyridoxal phosphate-dependent enzyme [Candidatus Marinimicrobia bacterium]|nr:aminotransferase class I/II-fold pyridoxal phosphate-dependent enzyme [Candidatus Neomarinimicrobiota bacterium]